MHLPCFKEVSARRVVYKEKKTSLHPDLPSGLPVCYLWRWHNFHLEAIFFQEASEIEAPRTRTCTGSFYGPVPLFS